MRGRAGVVATGVVVIGDTLLDVDVDGRIERTTPDAGLPVLDVTGEAARPGGAGLAAALLAADGVAVTLVTALCADDAGARLRALLHEPVAGPAQPLAGPAAGLAQPLAGPVAGLAQPIAGPGPGPAQPIAVVAGPGPAQPIAVVAGPGRGGTVVKTRLAGLGRVDRGDGRPAAGFAAAVAAPLRAALRGAAAVLVSDYGRGVATDPLIRSALREALLAGLPVVWDPHPRGPAPVPGVTVATPNLAEARGVSGHSAGTAEAVGRDVARAWSARAVAVTCGAHGAVLVGDSGIDRVSAPRVSGGDPCGAGDAFAGSLAAALAEGRPHLDAVRHAVHRAAHFVGQGGAGAFAARRAGPYTQVSGLTG